jgi:hypothetical protein
MTVRTIKYSTAHTGIKGMMQRMDPACFVGPVTGRVAKVVRSSTPQICEGIRRIRSELARIRFADKDDSHIGFVDISTKGSPRPKFR